MHFIGSSELSIAIMACVLLVLTGCGAMVVGGAADGNYQHRKDVRSQQVISQDSSITTMINSRYVDDTRINALDLHVKTWRGNVTLTGHVHTDYDANYAIRVAKSVSGVSKVISRLEVISH